jgi:hypothetical protein
MQGGTQMDIREYQSRCQETDHIGDKGPNWLFPLVGLQGELGSLSTAFKKKLRDHDAYLAFHDEVSRTIGNCFWYLAALASRLEIDLGDLLEKNLALNKARWPQRSRGQSVLNVEPDFDSAFPDGERLPRRLTVEFECIEDEEDGVILRKVRPIVDGEPIGDEIDDNAWKEDGYRFHDVMHMAHIAYLGWSPVFRALLSVKRKSNADIDRIEDGARARDTEEAITRMIHSYASEHNWLNGVNTIDTSFLNLISQMAKGLEVAQRNNLDWQEAILEAYRIRKLLIDGNGGYVTADFDGRKLEFGAFK